MYVMYIFIFNLISYNILVQTLVVKNMHNMLRKKKKILFELVYC